LIIMGIVSLACVFMAWAATFRPVPVVAFDKTGRALLFSNTAQGNTTTDIRLKQFLNQFITLQDGVSGRPGEDLTAAYNMMIPKFREILLLQGAGASKVEEWTGKNISSSFRLTATDIRGDLSVGSKVAIIGTGELTLRPAVAPVEDRNSQITRQIFFKAQVLVMPITEAIPWGMLIEYYSSNIFESQEALKSYLMQNNIPLLETGVAK